MKGKILKDLKQINENPEKRKGFRSTKNGKPGSKTSPPDQRKVNQRQGRTAFWGRLQSIRAQLTIGLMIPIVLLAVYGFISYKKSEKAIVNNYEKSSMDTIDAISKYMNLGFSMIEKSSLELSLDINFKNFFDLDYDFAVESKKTYDDIYDRMSLNVISNPFIEEMHLIGKNGLGMSTTGAINKNLYDSIVASDLGTEFKKSQAQFLWKGDHSELDQVLKQGSNEYNKNRYATTLIRKMSNGRGFIIVDISTIQINSMFAEYNMGKGSILGFITGDGREILANTEEEYVFKDLYAYTESLNAEEASNYTYVDYLGEDYLFIHSKVEGVNGMVTALIPKSTILNEVRGIRALSFAFITFASILAVFVVFLIIRRITDTIKVMNHSILQVSKGDLTTEFHVGRQDEFQDLSLGISDMIIHMRSLIGDVQEVGTTVSSSVVSLSNNSGDLLNATLEISRTIDEMGHGMIQQAEDAECCLHQMSNLSEQISQININTTNNEQIATITKNVADEGLNIINELRIKSKATTEITDDIIQKIKLYERQSKEIEDFVNIIDEIASQTNLLSLNASIEAARAGNAGRGFAVVAEEIRKLADQSINAAKQIQNTVKEINIQNKEVVETAERAGSIVATQTEVLNTTVDAFDNISIHVNELADNFKEISNRLTLLESVKDDTLNAIQNISAVTEESAAASEEVNATAQNQIASVQLLQEAAIILEEDARKLEKAIQIFVIK